MDPRREAQAFFTDKAAAYRASASHGNRADLDRMVRLVAPRPGERALDVATGGGHTAEALARAGCRVVATDVTRAMLAPLAHPRALADAAALPFRSGAFDVVACRIAAHHFPNLDAFVAEVARVLAPGGRFYAFDLTEPEDAAAAAVVDRVERLRDPSHVRSWSAGAWRAALARAGLSGEVAASVSAFDLEPWVARARMAPAAERELRDLLARHARAVLGGYGVEGGTMHVLRVEVVARKR